MFAYCGNNPVMYSDPTGSLQVWIPAFVEDLEEKTEEYLTPSNTYGTFIGLASIFTSSMATHLITSIKSSTRPANIGPGLYAKQCAAEIARVRSFEANYCKISNILAYGAVAIDVFIGVADNISKGSSGCKIIYDAAVDIVFTGGTIWVSGLIGSKVGALAGTLFPGIGNVVGSVAGFIIGVGIYVCTDMIFHEGKTLRNRVKDMVS